MSITFSYINHLKDATPITASSENVDFPVENVLNPFRSKAWRTQVGQVTGQYVVFDCGFQVRPTTFFLTNEQRGIQLSPQATIKLQGCNDGNWTTPEVDITLDWDANLITKTQTPYFGSCRFWRVLIDDANNIDNYLEVSNLFLGESVTFSSTDLNLGWADEILDDSDKIMSDGSEAWFDQKSQRAKYDFDLLYMSHDEMLNLKEFFSLVGQHEPFYLRLDPEHKITTLDSELSVYCRFTSALKFTNPFYKLYNVNLTIEEVL